MNRTRFAARNCRLLLAPGLAFWLCAAAPPPVHAPETVQSYNTYKSWFVACDNTLNCVAKGFNQAGGRAEFSISRASGPEGKLNAVIAADSTFTRDDIKLDGHPLPLAQGWQRVESGGDGSAFATSSPAVLRDFIERIRNGAALVLPGEDMTIPLDGLTAALRRMDDRQGRIGGATALLDLGPAPADQVPAAPPVPSIPVHPIQATLGKEEDGALIAQTRKGGAGVMTAEQCDQDVDVKAMPPQAYALTGRQALVLIPCIMGAYQGSYIGFLADRAGGAVRELKLPLPYRGDDDPNHGMTTWLTGADFEPSKGMLSMADKGRGLADCGVAASWVWDGEAFHLTAFAMQEQCGGVAPGDWPVMFRSAQ
jgi:hypothetical protein